MSKIIHSPNVNRRDEIGIVLIHNIIYNISNVEVRILEYVYELHSFEKPWHK